MDAPPIVVAFDEGDPVAPGFVPGRRTSLAAVFDRAGLEDAFPRHVDARLFVDRAPHLIRSSERGRRSGWA
ncbi:hypothetical protein [Methylobacterium sp. J-090]|uniref:hypothetical protein n=1 Tax=Methylobacterium sp. J-090 TaxID=2836666 RepID=UPI001FBA2477|nr:hypothetical protein [Methylobacterium sp. J-090]MCJ2081290.1 hypothetical protein [Methylobacterium sp. J-090]